jgi:putative methionine-R-sulfoxide reductase with GAF domain
VNAAEICQELERRKADGAPLSRLLVSAVELLHDSNARFDWTGIYELYPDHVLRLGPYIGAATDHVFIAVGNGLCGTAIAERRNINVPDVTKVDNYLSCSSSTRSELVVLIRLRDTIFAQIDIDSQTPNAFGEETVRGVERVAGWLARAYEARDLACRR